MHKDKTEPATKLTYTPPRLREIELVAEEVLATGCKLGDQGSAYGVPYSCILNNCAREGS